MRSPRRYEADGLAGYAVQCWYYDQIRRVASGGGPLLRAGCYAALLRNLKAEAAAAKALVGVDCKGTAYGGLDIQLMLTANMLASLLTNIIARRVSRRWCGGYRRVAPAEEGGWTWEMIG